MDAPEEARDEIGRWNEERHQDSGEDHLRLKADDQRGISQEVPGHRNEEEQDPEKRVDLGEKEDRPGDVPVGGRRELQGDEQEYGRNVGSGRERGSPADECTGLRKSRGQVDQGRREERFVQEPEVIEPRRADEVGRRREADPHAGEAGHDQEEPALDRARLHQEDERPDEDVDQTHREEGTAPSKDGREAQASCRDAQFDPFAVADNRVGVRRAGFRRAQVAEEELFERTVGVPVDGDNGVARAEARRLAGIEDLGDDVRPGVVHRPPTEVGAVPPPDDVQPIETIHRRGQRDRDAELHPMGGNGRRRLPEAHLTLPGLRVRRALLCGGPSPCERSHDEEQRGGSD